MLKQSVGVDISKDDFVVYFELLFTDQTTKKLGKRKFDNTPKGVKVFVEWLEKKSFDDVPLQVVMEATGRYHEVLAYHLYESHYRVCIVLPNRIKHFAHSLHQFSKTDAIDAAVIAHYGSCQLIEAWEPSSPSMRQLRELTRECHDVKKMRTQTLNRLSAMRAAAKPLQSVVKRLKEQIAFFDRQIKEINNHMEALAHQDQSLGEQVEQLASIPNIGRITAFILLSETAGFALFKNRSQLIKYAGLDVVERQSGTSVRGKSKISKRGNGHLRSALFMPGLSALKSPGIFRDAYDRHLKRHQNPRKAHMAVQRKLLLVAFAVHQSGQNYDIEVHRSDAQNGVGEQQGSPTVARLTS